MLSGRPTARPRSRLRAAFAGPLARLRAAALPTPAAPAPAPLAAGADPAEDLAAATVASPAPDTPPEAPAPALSAPAERLPPRPNHAQPLSILVVDDNRINQKVVARIIESEGHSYRGASDGEAALDAMGEGGFDLVLMDVNMPTLDGIETTKRYRDASPGVRRLPILALTADASPETIERCKDAGMDGFIPKPIRATALFDAIGSALAAAAVPRPS